MCARSVLLAALLVILAPAGRAQTYLGLGGGVGLVVGGGGDLLDGGPLLQASASRSFGRVPSVSLRVSGAYHLLDRDRDAVSGNRASNTMLSLLAGPELAFPVWRFEPFLHGGAGVTVNLLSASAGGSTTVDATSSALTWAVEGGSRLRLTHGARPIHAEVAGVVLLTGDLAFARVNDPPQRFTDRAAVLVLRGGLRVGL